MALTMSQKLVFAAMLAFALWNSQATARTLPDALVMTERHESWMAQHGRTYKDAAEKAKRLKIFKDNVERIESFNRAGDRPYKLGVNKFADMTHEERQASLNGYKMSSPRPISYEVSSFKYANVTEVPSSMDWRQKGSVAGVKDQGQCGSCWAFSAVAAMEGIIQIKTGKLVSLSEQELVDCETEDYGCHGGEMYNAFEYIIKNHGLTSESNYPYQAVDGTCRKEKISSAATITDYEEVPANSESALLKAVANQPVSVAIDASAFDFYFYESGIYTGENCGTYLDHGVTAVGYGETSDGMKYWLIKNSWGETWGDHGYIKMKRDIEAKEGVCGVAMEALYPTA